MWNQKQRNNSSDFEKNQDWESGNELSNYWDTKWNTLGQKIPLQYYFSIYFFMNTFKFRVVKNILKVSCRYSNFIHWKFNIKAKRYLLWAVFFIFSMEEEVFTNIKHYDYFFSFTKSIFCLMFKIWNIVSLLMFWVSK